MTSNVIQGHIRSLLCLNHSSTFVYGPILIKKTNYEDNIRPEIYLFIMEKFCDLFTLRPSDLIITLTYVLMDNFCPRFRILMENFCPRFWIRQYPYN